MIFIFPLSDQSLFNNHKKKFSKNIYRTDWVIKIPSVLLFQSKHDYTGETRGLFTLYGDFRVFVLYSLGRMLFHMSLLLKGEEADGLRIMLASKDKLGPKIFAELMHSGKLLSICKKLHYFFLFWEPFEKKAKIKVFSKNFLVFIFYF